MFVPEADEMRWENKSASLKAGVGIVIGQTWGKGRGNQCFCVATSALHASAHSKVEALNMI